MSKLKAAEGLGHSAVAEVAGMKWLVAGLHPHVFRKRGWEPCDANFKLVLGNSEKPDPNKALFLDIECEICGKGLLLKKYDGTVPFLLRYGCTARAEAAPHLVSNQSACG